MRKLVFTSPTKAFIDDRDENESLLLGPKWPNISLRSSETALYELKRLRDIDGLSWPEIASRKEYYPIPIGTLNDWYMTGKYPQKWKDKLRIVEDFRYRRACNMIDVKSCADTLEGYMHKDNIEKLIAELERRGYGSNRSGHRDGQVG